MSIKKKYHARTERLKKKFCRAGAIIKKSSSQKILQPPHQKSNGPPLNTRKFKIPEKLHHCQRSKKWFTWHIISITSENKPQYYINTNEIPGELSRENLIFTCENNMLSSHVKISVSPLLWLHNKSRLSHQKTIKVKWFGTLLVFI